MGEFMYDKNVVLSEEEKALVKTAQRAIELARESVWEKIEDKGDISLHSFNALVGPLAAAIFADLRKSAK